MLAVVTWLQVFALRRPFLHNVLDYEDEFFALLMLVLETHSLRTTGFVLLQIYILVLLLYLIYLKVICACVIESRVQLLVSLYCLKICLAWSIFLECNLRIRKFREKKRIKVETFSSFQFYGRESANSIVEILYNFQFYGRKSTNCIIVSLFGTWYL